MITIKGSFNFLILSSIFGIILFLSVHSKSFASSNWAPTSPLLNPVASHSIIQLGSKMYVISGANSVITPNILFGDIGIDGNITSWNIINSSPAVFWHSSTIYNNYIYLLGGATNPPTASTNKVYLGKLTNDTIPSWTNLNPLPKPLSIGKAWIYNNKVYFAGGFTEQGGNVYNQKIYVSSINLNDGTIGAWTEAGELPVPLSGFGLFLEGDRVTILGGENSGGKSNKTYTSTIQPNDNIGPWQETSSLPNAISRAQFTRYNSTIFSIGGIKNDGSTSDEIYYTQIKSDGSLESWQTSTNKIPQPTCCGSAVLSNDFMYLIGGHNTITGEYYDEVFFTKPSEITTNGDFQALNVPYFSQNASPWGDKEYDHAKSLKFPNTKFERWGCAVTSVAMIMRYNNINSLPNGTPIDPGSLNSWLKNNDGYLTGKDKEGNYSYLNFPAISVLSKKIFDADKSRFKLEYYREKPTTANLDTFLSINKHPVLLKVNNTSTSSHFVVAKGKTNNVYQINDPEWNYPSLSNFNNTFSQIDRFVPAYSDLSYIVIVVNPKTHLLITDPEGKKTGSSVVNGKLSTFDEIPNASYSYQLPISNPDYRGRVESLGTGVNEFLLPKPKNGKYVIKASSLEDRRYEMNISTFQENGNNKLDIIKDSTNSRESIILEFNQKKSAKIKRVKICDEHNNKSAINSNSTKNDRSDSHDHNHDDKCED